MELYGIKNLLKDENLSEYRALPFWSWNDELDPEELKEQIRWMKEQGFGGYFMHARGGLKTEYLGDKWFKCISECVDLGNELGMQSWAYDENGWPSGFAGGKLLEDKENRDRFLTFKIGEFDGNAKVSYYLGEEELIRAVSGGNGKYLNVYEHYSASTADILNPEVVDKFIALTHEEYKKRLGNKFNRLLKGFFTDEPQYNRWNHPYTKMIEKYFKDVYGQDILDGLGLLFVKKKGYGEFRYKFWLGMQTLMLNAFAEKIYSWCSENGVMLTGHYVEEPCLETNMHACAGIMPFYEYMHIPGVDHLCLGDNSPVASKQVASVAAQTGKKRILTETFGCCGWETTPKQFKKIAEKQFVCGVNLLCQHLLPYSEHGQRKRDYPAHFSWANPWVRKDYKSFNDYFARLGYLIGESTEKISVALFCPIRSMYLHYVHPTFELKEYPIDKSYISLAEKLSAMNVPYHIIDETVMEKHGKVDGNKLAVGKCEYDFIVFPKTEVIGKNTKKLFDEFYKNGGKMLFTDDKPSLLEGAECEFIYDTNVTFSDIAAAQEYGVTDYGTEIQSCYREICGQKFIYAVNLSDDLAYDFEFTGDFNGFTALDIETLETRPLGKTVHFEPTQSYVLFPTKEKNGYVGGDKTFTLSAPFKVAESSDNYLTLDKLRFSVDGVNYSKLLTYMGVFNELLNRRYNGELYLCYTFAIKDLPNRLYLLSENMNNIRCTVNGTDVQFDGVSDFEKQIYRADIVRYVKTGQNDVVLKINFFESEDVYYALFGENVTEGLRNCLSYDTTIEACYLQGDFGVYSESGFTEGETTDIVFADDFYIGNKNTTVTDPVREGYPFFAGNITLEKTFEYVGGPTVLKLNGRYSLSEIKVNGIAVKKSYFADKADLKDYIKIGKNKVQITLWTGNRNLLGPFHYAECEKPEFVGPDLFELFGSWEKGESALQRKNYAFVRFGLFEDRKG